MRKTPALVPVLLMAAISGAAAQTRAPAPVLAGTWQVDTPDGPQLVIVRPDSSASFGEEIVRWRLLGERLYLAFGDEWIGYDLALAGDSLTLSGGDLEEPVTMKRVGPPKPRPPGVEVPPAPPFRPPA